MKRGDRVRFSKLKATVGGRDIEIEPDRELERTLNLILEAGPELESKSLNPSGAYLEKDRVTVVVPPTGASAIPVPHQLRDRNGRALIPAFFRIIRQVGSGSIWWIADRPATTDRVIFAGSSTGGATFTVELYREE